MSEQELISLLRSYGNAAEVRVKDLSGALLVEVVIPLTGDRTIDSMKNWVLEASRRCSYPIVIRDILVYGSSTERFTEQAELKIVPNRYENDIWTSTTTLQDARVKITKFDSLSLLETNVSELEALSDDSDYPVRSVTYSHLQIHGSGFTISSVQVVPNSNNQFKVMLSRGH